MARRIRLKALLAGAALVAAACSAPPNPGAAPVDRDLITRDQLLKHHFLTIYDAVAALHSNWLQERGVDSFNTPGKITVFMDETNMGGVDALQNITTDAIQYIRFYDAVHATQRWGVGHTQGVIYLSTTGK